MAKLRLYLKGEYFQTQDINIPLFSDLPMEQRYTAREDFVTAEKTKFRINYLRAIIKCEFDYHIELFIYSDIIDNYDEEL